MVYFCLSIFTQTESEMRIKGVNFTCREDPSGIYLLADLSSGGGVLQYWELCEQERPIHPLFSSSGTGTTRSLQWQCRSMFSTNGQTGSICPTRHVWATAHESGAAQHHLIIATRTGDVICLQRDNMQQVRWIKTAFRPADLIVCLNLCNRLARSTWRKWRNTTPHPLKPSAPCATQQQATD